MKRKSNQSCIQRLRSSLRIVISLKRTLQVDKTGRHYEGSGELESLEPVSTYFTEMMNFVTYRITLQLQKYKGPISDITANWAKF